MISVMLGVTMVDRVLTNVLRDKVSAVVKIQHMIIQNRVRSYGCVICRDINSQIHEVMELEIAGKRNKSRPRKLRKECVKNNLEQSGSRRKDAYN